MAVLQVSQFWFRSGDWNETALRAVAKFEPGVMVWEGAIGPGFKSKLMGCSDGVEMAEYRRIISDSGMIEACDAAVSAGRGAVAHGARDGGVAEPAREPLARLAAQSLRSLSSIEMVWAIMGTRLAGRCFGTRSERFATLQAVWDDISLSTTGALVADFRRRCTFMIEANGASISQLLSSHVRQPRPCDVWPEEQDRVLLRWVRGRKWKELSRSVEALAGFSAAELNASAAYISRYQTQTNDVNPCSAHPAHGLARPSGTRAAGLS